MSYSPSTPPSDEAGFRSWVVRELASIAESWNASREFSVLDTLYAEPLKLIDGMVVKADGSTWDPGSGAGFYGYRSGAWHFLG